MLFAYPFNTIRGTNIGIAVVELARQNQNIEHFGTLYLGIIHLEVQMWIILEESWIPHSNYLILQCRMN
jgi:hypothetical protein